MKRCCKGRSCGECKAKRRAYQKSYRSTHREKLREYASLYYKEHRDSLLKASREYYNTHPDCHAVETKRRGMPFGEQTGLEPVEAQAVAGSTPVPGTKSCQCGKEISKRAMKCKSCAVRSRGTKIIWPTKEELLGRLGRSNYLALSRELGVSDNAIRKHLHVAG